MLKLEFIFPKTFLVIFMVCFASSVLFSVSNDPSSKNKWRTIDFKPVKEDAGKNRTQQIQVEQGKRFSSLFFPEGLKKNSSLKENHTQHVEFKLDKFLGGLLPEGLNEKSCLSRYQSFQYRRGQKAHRPSSHLISKLRNYEALHKRCGPETKSFKKSMEYLNSGNYSDATDCKYVVWIPRDGLGNRMITLVSAFLYALLTQKVFLVYPGAHISDLFCEPFPEASWLIPSDFPPLIINRFKSIDKKSSKSYGNMLKKKVLGTSNSSLIPPYVHLYIVNNYDNDDKRVFCDQDQTVLRKVPWLIIKFNIYFVPSLFLMPSFQQELSNLFPEKETVFHFLGRYIFHPSNTVWKSVTSYYNSHLAKADEKIGIQIRIFRTNPDPYHHLMNQTLACVLKENNLLPGVNEKEHANIPSGKSNRTKAVLMTSLSSRYYEAIRNMYGTHPTVTGEVIQVFQPSSEWHQHSEKRIHNMKAWTDIYLLSLTDKLVTSSKSTFGYVAQSLGGLRPWILYKPHEYTAPNPACQRALSMEPCFQAPPMFDCRTNKRIDTGKIVPYVRHCEDMNWNRGLKLFDKDDKP